ncbi:MAG: HlyD family efflux transporter periplasmic adaptor subunit [bacterium]|nr:HlyD family efflux transporter periplasmic adaptor subunit [bacterium]
MTRYAQYFALTKKVGSRFSALRRKFPYRKTVLFLQKRPFTSFFTALGVLFLLIVLGSVLRSLNRPVEKKPDLVKSVQTYTIGRSPTVSVQATVAKYGVVKILAQTSGIVDRVYANEGQEVGKGTAVVGLSSTYSGANAPAIQAQIAQNQYKNILDTYDTQKGIIATQRQLTTESRENADQMRQIAQRAIGDTSELLRYSENMLSLANQSIGNTPSDPQDTQFTNPLQTQRSQLLAGVVQARAQLRSLEQQSDVNKAPNKLADLQKDSALKQLDLQEKALDLQKETSRLQAALAGINASLMKPSSPFSGTVERIFVRPGQTVNPGTPIAIVSQHDHEVTAVAEIPYAIAAGISLQTPSEIKIGNKTVTLTPTFVSTDATDGQLYSIKYTIPLAYEKQLTDGQSVVVNVPVGFGEDTNSPDGTVAFVPLDSIYQTQSESFVYINSDGKARARNVQLGDVFGRYVRVTSGLKSGDTIILTRNVVENDTVRVN